MLSRLDGRPARASVDTARGVPESRRIALPRLALSSSGKNPACLFVTCASRSGPAGRVDRAAGRLGSSQGRGLGSAPQALCCSSDKTALEPGLGRAGGQRPSHGAGGGGWLGVLMPRVPPASRELRECRGRVGESGGTSVSDRATPGRPVHHYCAAGRGSLVICS